MLFILFFFFFNDTATTEIYTLSLHDALPISTIQRPSGEVTVGPHVPSIAVAGIVGASPPPASRSADSVPPPARGSISRAFVVRRVHAPSGDQRHRSLRIVQRLLKSSCATISVSPSQS